MIRPAGLALTLALACPAGAFAFEIGWPVACRLGETCFIQNHVDRDPGPEFQDFRCGPLGYDGHDGTDIALPSLAAMAAGVPVLAAAPGTVRAVRDGMPDIRVTDPAAPPLAGRDCGNGVVIDHGGGWETQYCHLARGSVLVGTGARVAAGAPLGRVGLSGRTEFPHLHLSVRKDGRALDPFDPDDTLTCAGDTSAPLWADPLDYQAGGLIGAGFATEVPAFDAIKAGPPAREVLPAKAPALVIWAYYFGNRAGDTLRLTITGPEGQVISESVALERTQAQAFRAVGKRLRGPAGWPAGAYRGEAVLIRDGAAIDRIEIAARVEG